MGFHCFTGPDKTRITMLLLISSFLCQQIVSSLSMSFPTRQGLNSPYLIPVELIPEDTENFIKEDSIEDPVDDHYNPTGEDILEALLTQIDYPEASEAIYNSLFKVDKKDEELAHQLSFLKSEDPAHPDITDRKYFLEEPKYFLEEKINSRQPLRRRKRSIPPFVNDKTHKRMQQQ